MDIKDIVKKTNVVFEHVGVGRFVDNYKERNMLYLVMGIMTYGIRVEGKVEQVQVK